MEAVTIRVEPRKVGGTRGSRRLRLAGKVPGVFYGPKSPAVAILVDATEFRTKILRLGASHLIRLDAEGPKLRDRVVLLKEIQRHPVTSDVLHADFYEVDLEAKIRVVVRLRYTGKAVGVTQGGILQPIKRDLEVECLPTDIPDNIEVDVTDLGVHGVMHVKDLTLPAEVVACAESGETVVTVLPPTVEEEKVVEEAVPVEAVEGAGEAAAAAPAAQAEEGEKGGAKN